MTPFLWKKARGIKEPLDEGGRGEWKSWLKIQHSENKDIASGPITSWQIDGETMTDLIFLGSRVIADNGCSHEIKRHLLVGRKAMTNLDSILKSSSVQSLSCVWLFATPWTVPIRLLCPWDFPGKSAGVDCRFLFQGIFSTQGSNPGLPRCRQTLYRLSHQGR